MKSAKQLVWIGALVVFAGCSGQYRVGSDAASAGAPSAQTSAGGASSSTGGNVSVAGAASNLPEGSDPGTFCGSPLPTTHDVQFAPPAVVYQRVSKFLIGVEHPAPADLPSETTRQWAGTLAASLLASLDTPSALGIDRFVSKWWPGTPAPEPWAAYFSSKQGTLVDLLTTDSLLPSGAGVLTDPAVLSHPGFTARGQYVSDHLLCVRIAADVVRSPISPLQEGQSRRSQLESEVAGQACTVCHSYTDPVGYALGHFATDGSYQSIDNDAPIDAEATVRLPGGNQATVRGAQDLGKVLANSCEVATCLIRSLLQDATDSANLLPSSASPEQVTLLASQFAAAGLSLPELVRLVVESDAFLSAD